MAEGPDNRPPDLVLSDTAWLRGFTRKLVREVDRAEDVVQDTLIASLSGSGPARSRPWLAQVARNLAISLLRRDVRRRECEKRVPEKDNAPGTADVVAEAELQRAAVDALMNLDEPYRSTLLLRFMKGLSYRDVARRLEVPVETVRTRIKRGLALLRGRLDRDHGGRNGWLPSLGIPALPLLRTASLWGIVIMKTKLKVVAAAMGIAALFGLWYVLPVPPSVPEVPREVADGGTAQRELPVEASDPAVVERLTLTEPGAETLPETGTLVVRTVWGDSGEPAPHVGVRIVEDTWTNIGRMGSTGPDGAVRFEGLAPGNFSVTPDRPMTGTYGSKDVKVLSGEDATLELVLNGKRNVRGIVVDSEGAPVGGARIHLMLAAVWPHWLFPTVRTEADGTFFLRALGDAYMVGARAEGYGTSDFTLVGTVPRDGRDEAQVRLVLPGSPAALVGAVFDPEGRTVEGAWVAVGKRPGRQARPDGTSGQVPPQQFLHTDSEGMFELGNLRSGNAPVLVYARGFAPWQQEVDLVPSGTTSLSVELQRGASLFGQVTDGAGNPLEGARVELSGYSYPQRSSATTDGVGHFRIEDLSGGELAVRVYEAKAGNLRTSVQVAAGQENRWDVTLSKGLQIQGLLVDERGKALEEWWVRDEEGVGVPVDAEGRFAFTNVEDRAYTLRVYRSWSFEPIVVSLEDVSPGALVQTFTVPDRAMPSAKILGRVLTPEGRPAAGVQVVLRQGSFLAATGGDTDEEGRFEIGPLPPGRYSLTGSLTGFVQADFGEITLVADEFAAVGDGRLGYGAWLQVELVSSRAEPLRDLQVRVVDENGRTLGRGGVQGTSVSFHLLPPGSHFLTVEGPNVTIERRPIELRAQATLSVEVTLR